MSRAGDIGLGALAAVAVGASAFAFWKVGTPPPTDGFPAATSTVGDVVTLQQFRGGATWSVDLAAVPGSPGGESLHQLVGSRVEGPDGSVDVLSDAYSAYEYAALVGTDSGEEWVGNVHGFERQDDLTVTVDGQEFEDGFVRGEQVDVVRLSTLFAPDDSGTELGAVTTTYTVDESGLTVEWQIRWATEAAVNTFYPAMLPVNDTLGTGLVGGEEIDLTVDVGGAAEGSRVATDTLAMAGGGVTATVTLDDLAAVDDWSASAEGDGLAYLEDRDGGKVNKGYFTRVSRTGGPVWVQPGETWSSTATYTVTVD